MTFEIPWLIASIPVAIAAVIALPGIYLYLKVSKLGGAVMLSIGLLFGFVFGPMLFRDRVVIDRQHIEQRTGFWFAPTVKGFDFEGLRRMVIEVRPDRKGRTKEIWIGEYASGQALEVDPGDLWEWNGDPIIRFMEALDIEVIRPARDGEGSGG